MYINIPILLGVLVVIVWKIDIVISSFTNRKHVYDYKDILLCFCWLWTRYMTIFCLLYMGILLLVPYHKYVVTGYGKNAALRVFTLLLLYMHKTKHFLLWFCAYRKVSCDISLIVKMHLLQLINRYFLFGKNSHE